MSVKVSNQSRQVDLHDTATEYYAAREFAPGELFIRRMEKLLSNRAVLARRTYFEGGNVLVCHAGKFRFRFEDSPDAIELCPREVLVLYPGNVVTIEALQRGSMLKYVIFSGARTADFLDGFGLYDRLRFSSDTQQELFDLALKSGDAEGNRALSLLCDALRSFSRALRTGKDASRHAMLASIHRHVRTGFPRLKAVCDELGIDRVTLYRRFAACGLGNPGDYINMQQYRRARQLLQSTAMPIADIARAVGISSPIYFSAFIRRHSGLTPTKLREAGMPA